MNIEELEVGDLIAFKNKKNKRKLGTIVSISRNFITVDSNNKKVDIYYLNCIELILESYQNLTSYKICLDECLDAANNYKFLSPAFDEDLCIWVAV